MKSQMLQAGFVPSKADAIGGIVANALTSAGATQATASICTGDSNIFTTVAAGTGAILGAPAIGSTLNALMIGDKIKICNYGANALLVYPPVGGTIATGVANASVSLAVGACAVFECYDSTPGAAKFTQG